MSVFITIRTRHRTEPVCSPSAPDPAAHPPTVRLPELTFEPQQPSQLRLAGGWTLDHADAIRQQLADAPPEATAVDVSQVDRLDSLGVLQLMRFARRRDLDFSHFHFHERHRALVAAIEDVADDRPRRKREYGVNAALERMGHSVVDNFKESTALIGFLGEVLSKIVRMVREPTRFRPTATVHHMEQVGLDAVPLVALLCYMVGAVVAFLGANVLRDFGAVIYVVELVSISFLREFGVLLTAIILAGRTASAFTAQIGAMKSREEVDAIRTLGMDPIDLLVIPRLLALVVMLPLLTFVAMVFGLLGGLTVGAYGLDIPPPQYLSRMQDTMEVRHFIVGLVKAPMFAVVIALIGCLEGLQVQGTAQSVGERTTSSVVQAISMVIVLDALAAIWFMELNF
ncbi:ABC transporter permease [Aerolutibacter daejeonensis]|uniref:ABC transporter permease n=1 Tax=Aerolutibacter daejeonensis TaxID=346181 RepID=UPI000A054316|nr:MlaE family lipid ABC transporter permease subunit [Lysobacter daejeonensis]